MSGDTAVVGAPGMHGNPRVGAAYVFTRAGDTWTEQAKLTPSDGLPGDRFGWSVAISGDTIVVSSSFGDVSPNVDQGSAYVFTRTAGTWTEQAELTASDGAPLDMFGFSVAISGDTIVVGDPSDNGQGSAYVFTRRGGDWPEQERLTASDAADGDYFGRSVAVSGDTVVVGAQFDEVGGNVHQGSGYVFRRTRGTWTQRTHLTAPDGTGRRTISSESP